MTPEDVPETLMETLRETELPAPRLFDDGEAWARWILAAVLPEHERQIRAKVAKAIEETVCAPPEGHTKPCPDCYRYKQMQKDARIARGQS